MANNLPAVTVDHGKKICIPWFSMDPDVLYVLFPHLIPWWYINNRLHNSCNRSSPVVWMVEKVILCHESPDLLPVDDISEPVQISCCLLVTVAYELSREQFLYLIPYEAVIHDDGFITVLHQGEWWVFSSSSRWRSFTGIFPVKTAPWDMKYIQNITHSESLSMYSLAMLIISSPSFF